jgi:hypothetical protein
MITVHARTDAEAVDALIRETLPREYSVRVQSHGESLADIARRRQAETQLEADILRYHDSVREADRAMVLLAIGSALALLVLLVVLR